MSAEFEQRIAALERQLESVQAQMQRRGQPLRAPTPWVAACLGVLLAAASWQVPASTQASLPQPGRAITKLNLPVVFMDGGRTVAEFRRGGLTLYGLTADTRWDMGVTSTNNLFLQGMKGAGPALKLERRGMTIFNEQGLPAVSLSRTESGSGELLLGSPKGSGALVEAGMTPDGRGVVRVYPQGGPPPTVIPRTLMGGKP